MTEVEFMMEKFHLSEDEARTALANGFKAGALMGNSAMEWVKRESGIGRGLAEAAREVETLRESFKEVEK